MRAARLFGPADLRIVEEDRPTPGPDEVLVAVRAYAPYGTDVGVYLNRYGRYVSAYPVGLGADFSGVVAALGSGVTDVAIGDRVAALALDHCGACSNCRAGRTNICLDPAFAVPVRQTCCEDYALVSARKLARLPDSVTFEDGAMLAGIVDALNAYDKMGLKAGDTVAVIGVGAMGHGAIVTAMALGLDVIAVGGSGARADMAHQLGARTVFPIAAHGEDIAPQILAAHPCGLAAIIETTATEWGLAQAFAIAAPGAAVALTGGGAVPLTAWDVVERELRIFGVRCGPDQRQALDLIADGRIDLKPTIAARYPLERAADAFALLAGPEARNASRVMILMGDTA